VVAPPPVSSPTTSANEWSANSVYTAGMNGDSAGAHYAKSDSSGIAQHPYDFSAIFHQFDLHA